MPSNETPAPAAAFTKRDLMRQTIALVERIIDLDTPANKRAYLVTSLSQYSKSFLVKIGELLQGDPVIAEGVARQLIDSEVEGVINETVHFYRLLDIDDYWEASALIRSLSQYDAFISKPDLSKVSPEAQEQCLALISATRIITSETEIPYGDSNHPVEYIINGDWAWHVIQDEKLVDLILERPQCAETIAHVVAKHQVTDPNTVIGIMQGIIPALAEGAL